MANRDTDTRQKHTTLNRQSVHVYTTQVTVTQYVTAAILQRSSGGQAEVRRRSGGGRAEISSGGDLLEVAQQARHVLRAQREEGVVLGGAQ